MAASRDDRPQLCLTLGVQTRLERDHPDDLPDQPRVHVPHPAHLVAPAPHLETRIDNMIL